MVHVAVFPLVTPPKQCKVLAVRAARIILNGYIRLEYSLQTPWIAYTVHMSSHVLSFHGHGTFVLVHAHSNVQRC